MSYKSLKIWKLAGEIVIEIDEMTLQLPQYEMFETGSQIRRSSSSIKTNIVEGYGRKQYKKDFMKFLVYALASKDETLDHLETLHDKGLLNNYDNYSALHTKIVELGKMMKGFLRAIER